MTNYVCMEKADILETRHVKDRCRWFRPHTDQTPQINKAVKLRNLTSKTVCTLRLTSKMLVVLCLNEIRECSVS